MWGEKWFFPGEKKRLCHLGGDGKKKRREQPRETGGRRMLPLETSMGVGPPVCRMLVATKGGGKVNGQERRGGQYHCTIKKKKRRSHLEGRYANHPLNVLLIKKTARRWAWEETGEGDLEREEGPVGVTESIECVGQRVREKRAPAGWGGGRIEAREMPGKGGGCLAIHLLRKKRPLYLRKTQTGNRRVSNKKGQEYDSTKKKRCFWSSKRRIRL